MIALDIFLLAVMGFGAFRGYRSGLAKQLVATVGVFLGFMIGASLMGPVGSAVVERVGFSERAAPLVGFVVIFGGVMAGASAVGFAFRKALDAVKLSSMDSMSGALLGCLKSAFGLSLLLLVAGFSPLPNGDGWLLREEATEGSLIHAPVRAFAPKVWSVFQLIAPGIQDALQDKFNNGADGRDDETAPVIT